ncbi:MAG: AsnC family transcriptional regulator [Candidatus Bathyarchaeia archaeon]|jgi:DNA-binding Lrp family transcriptional regulator
MNVKRGIVVLTEQVSAVQAKILKELIADGRKSDSEIAKKIGLTKEIVKKNRGQMEQAGIITGATIHINYKSFGYKAVAHLLINVDSRQEDQFIEYLQKMPEVYSFYKRGVKGNIDVITTLKTLEQLNEIKDAIKRHFSVLEMKTAIWTDVKEMNDNLAIIPDNRKNVVETINYQTKTQKKSNPQTMVIDQIDQKIADKLSENGRLSMETLSREIGISSDIAKRRYEKLKKNGVLKVTIQINPIKIGYQALCLFFTITSHENSLLIIEKISKIPDIISIMKTTGDYDLQIWAMVQDVEQLLSIQEELGKIRGILKIDMEVVRVRGKWPTPRQYISTF